MWLNWNKNIEWTILIFVARKLSYVSFLTANVVCQAFHVSFDWEANLIINFLQFYNYLNFIFNYLFEIFPQAFPKIFLYYQSNFCSSFIDKWIQILGLLQLALQLITFNLNRIISRDFIWKNVLPVKLYH